MLAAKMPKPHLLSATCRTGRRITALAFLRRLAIATPVLAGALPAALVSQSSETVHGGEILFYTGGSGERVLDLFRQHADLISVIGPQAYRTDSLGNVTGGVHPELRSIARRHGVRVMPLIVNPGFDQAVIHALLHDPAARQRAIDTMVELAVSNGFWGWQFDFENIHVSDRDAFTRFYREAANALHAVDKTISVAVVPTDGTPGETPFQRYMQDNWRNSFDVAELAAIGDFVSWMTYAQHGGVTAPGPIAGLPWVRAMLDHALAADVPPERLSLGIPVYSGWWFPGWEDGEGARVRGREIGYARARELLAAAGVEAAWVPELGVSYAFWSNRGVYEWLFLEDRRSLEAKLELLDAHPRIRGVSIWVLGAEDPEVWDVLERAFHP